MSDAALFEDSAFDATDEFEDSFEDFDLASDGLDELDDEFEAMDGWDGLDELELDGLDTFEDDGFEDEFGDFALDESSGLFMPGGSSLVSGPAAMSMMRLLNPAVMDSLDADEGDAFFGRLLGGLARRAVPFIRKALPMVQKVAGAAGPWGRLVSAGLGGVQGLMDGKGWKGALQGAVGGLLPGAAGSAVTGLLGNVLNADDAAVDAMADWADAHHGHHVAAARAVAHGRPAARAAHAVHAARPHAPAHGSPAHHAHAVRLHRAVALPIGAGLTTRAVAHHVLGHAMRHGARGPIVLSHARGILPKLRHVERTLLRAANAIPGTTGRKLRGIRHIGHRVAHAVHHAGHGGPAAAIRGLPQMVHSAVTRTVPRLVQSPRALMRSPAVAAKRVALRRRIVRRIPIEILFRAHIVRRAA